MKLNNNYVISKKIAVIKICKIAKGRGAHELTSFKYSYSIHVYWPKCSKITNLIYSHHDGRPSLVSENLPLGETLNGISVGQFDTATRSHQVLRRVFSKEFQTVVSFSREF